MKFLKQFYINSYVLVISAIITIILLICHSIYELTFMHNDITHFFLGFDLAFMALLVIALLYSYIKGESSYQKATMGAVLTGLTFTQILVLSGTIVLGNYSFDFEGVMAMAMFIILVNHFYLQVDHKGDKRVIKFNFIMIAFVFVMRVYQLLKGVFQQNLLVHEYFWLIEFITLLIMIACIEARIIIYKINRYEHIQNGTWTKEEKEKQKLIFKLF